MPFNLIYTSLHHIPEIKANGSIFIVDYRLAILKNIILLSFSITQSGIYYYVFFSEMRKEAQNV